MKSLIAGTIIALTLGATTAATVAPAEAFGVFVGPRGGVRVGLGGFGYGPRYGYGYRRFGYGYRRGFYGYGYRRGWRRW